MFDAATCNREGETGRDSGEVEEERVRGEGG